MVKADIGLTIILVKPGRRTGSRSPSETKCTEIRNDRARVAIVPFNGKSGSMRGLGGSCFLHCFTNIDS